ncbi:NAD-dependent epimerase/dehydratase family protein [Teichococcus aestuarii]|uniref:UDP-glucose 4-epimerase n=1 Tax=Teichococcus aestuarii TaxID=568898 RepID=A0A2U1VA22_9PROT|nr:NAD-dependent epimerase/dehydratase family protein [Pseudoroseomonas aestuarii]PWC30743.1 NAD-dependent epimerase [Pseudoroseomonas aestuarii]
MTGTRHHLILGGCGFIGRHVALLLAEAGETVMLCDRAPLSVTYPEAVRHRIGHCTADLATADWDAMLEGVAVVHHYVWASLPASANADPARDLALNTTPTLALLEAMRRRGKAAPRLVFSSSGGTVYGRLRQVPVPEEHTLAPITAYGAGKAAVELYLGLYRALYGLDCRVARLANPFGAGQDLARGQGAATTFLHHALTGQPITIWGDGEVVRDFIHIADAAAGMAALATCPEVGENWVVNIGSGQGTSLNTIIAELEARLGRRLAVRREPGRAFDVPVSVLDIRRARDVLGWAPRLSFAEGMSRTLSDLAGAATLSTMG